MKYNLKYPIVNKSKGLSAFRAGKGPEDKNLESTVSITGIRNLFKNKVLKVLI